MPKRDRTAQRSSDCFQLRDRPQMQHPPSRITLYQVLSVRFRDRLYQLNAAPYMKSR